MTVELTEKDSGSSPSQPQSVDPDDSACPLMDTSSPKSSPSKHTRNKINNDPIRFHEEYMQYLIVTLPQPSSGTENVQAWMQHILTSRRFNNLRASNIYWTGWDLHTPLLGDMMDELHDLGLTRRQSELVTLDITTAVLRWHFWRVSNGHEGSPAMRPTPWIISGVILAVLAFLAWWLC